jgi:hypothetical protein
MKSQAPPFVGWAFYGPGALEMMLVLKKDAIA